jgi:hypothetical protein
MAITTIDTRLYTGLAKMQRALDGLLQVRAQVTPAEIELSDAWQAALDPVMRDLYWYPLRNGINEAPDDVDELRAWLRERYDDATAVAILLLLLQRYQVRGANVGGQMALDDLGISGTFNLTNAEYRQLLDDHAAMLTTTGTDMSLIDTTIDDLSRGIPAARESEDNTLLVLGGLITGRSLARSAAIAVTETARSVATTFTWTLLQNDVLYQEFVTREDRRVCPRCGHYTACGCRWLLCQPNGAYRFTRNAGAFIGLCCSGGHCRLCRG